MDPFDFLRRAPRRRIAIASQPRGTFGFRHGATIGVASVAAYAVESLTRGPDPLPARLREIGITSPLCLGAMLVVATLLEYRKARVSSALRWLAAAGFLALLVSIPPPHPAVAFLLALSLMWLVLAPRLSFALRGGRPPTPTRRRGRAFLDGLMCGGLATWMLGAITGSPTTPGERLLVLVGVLVPLAIACLQLWSSGRRLQRTLAGGLAALVALGPWTDDFASWAGVLLIAAWPAARAFPLTAGGHADDARQGWLDVLLVEPARILVGTFLVVGLIGGAVLLLPPCTEAHDGLATLDAMFTSFSAVCVTGLITVDTPTTWTPLGQGVILLLIQLGGLGILTFSTAAFVLLRRRLSLHHALAVTEAMGSSGQGDLRRALRQVLRVTALFELAGAILLALLFLGHGDGIGQAAWRGLFTSISAFCNAGFALQTESLVPYQRDPLVLHTVAVLIVAGGLGPVVIAALPRTFRGIRTSLHARIVLVTTAVLLVVPALFILAVEWNHGLAHLSPLDRVHNAWFQSVTLRTAGFNSVDLTALQPVTWILMMALMFVGGSPGSTAGGIKTTTVAVLAASAWSAVRGRADVTMFGHRLPPGTMQRALGVALLGGLSVAFGVVGLQLTQGASVAKLAYEVVSAAGTVGLSLGATAELDGVGKVLVMVILFAGRVGPLTVVVLLLGRTRGGRWKLPAEEVPVG